MTHETLLLLLRCLDSQQLTVGSPDFTEVATQVIQARRELIAEIQSFPVMDQGEP